MQFTNCKLIRFVFDFSFLFLFILMSNQVVENVKVYCRVRPLLNDEIPDSQCVKAVDINKGRFSVDTEAETKMYI